MDRVKELLKLAKPLKYLFCGDSITHGVIHTFGVRDYTQLFAERVRFEMERMEDIIINSAISGNTTKDLLQGFKWRCEQFSPDIVFLMIGTNDSSDMNDITIKDFRNNMEELVGRFIQMNSLCVLQTTCPILTGTSPDREPYFDDYMQVVRDMAADFKIPLIDHTSYWRKREKDNYTLMSDSVHPNLYGHRFFAKYMYELLDIYDAESYCCRLFTP